MPTYITITEHPTNPNVVEVCMNDLISDASVMYDKVFIPKSLIGLIARGIRKSDNAVYFVEVNFMTTNANRQTMQLCALDALYDPTNKFRPVTSVLGVAITSNEQLYTELSKLY